MSNMNLTVPELQSYIQKAIVLNSQGGDRMVPREIILGNCLSAGFDESTINVELDRLVAEGSLSVDRDHHERVEDR